MPRTSSTARSTTALRKASWFVPTAKHWVDVENGNILRTMLGQILTGQLSVKKAAQTASANIAYTLNQS